MSPGSGHGGRGAKTHGAGRRTADVSLDDDIPDPPSLRGPQPRTEYEATGASQDDSGGDDYRREAIAEFLHEGAWAEAFGEWADATSLTAAEFDPVVDLGLIDEFDFYWDPSTDDVGFVAPTVPEEARADFDRDDVEEIEGELDTLGRIVTEVLENDYLLRDDADEQFGFFAEETDGDPADEG